LPTAWVVSIAGPAAARFAIEAAAGWPVVTGSAGFPRVAGPAAARFAIEAAAAPF